MIARSILLALGLATLRDLLSARDDAARARAEAELLRVQLEVADETIALLRAQRGGRVRGRAEVS